MKRFITYLYEYERGHKSKNAGFIKVDIRGTIVNMEVCVCSSIRSQEAGKICAIVNKNSAIGLPIGEIKAINGKGSVRLKFLANNILENGIELSDIVGIGIQFPDGTYFASCWNDKDAELVGSSNYQIKEDEPAVEQQCIEVEQVLPAVQIAESTEIEETSIEERQESLHDSKTIYKKIELDQLRTLPSPNWHLCNNSFLVHGFWNYGYLVLKKEIEADQEELYLGVPGIFEKPEMVMAVLFGFTDFEAFPEEMMEEKIDVERHFSRIEKNQEPKTGLFGCWFVKLQV